MDNQRFPAWPQRQLKAMCSYRHLENQPVQHLQESSAQGSSTLLSHPLRAVRISEFVEEVMSTDDNLVVVTHGFAATFFIAAFQRIDIDSMGYINYKLSPGSISMLEVDDLFANRTVRLLNG